MDIREHQHAGLRANARVCLHAERTGKMPVLFFFSILITID
ncbi:hypothetical protein ABQG71_11715 [Bacillus altitudinis]|uniref:Uncharacterized protein n=1 Tax=Bacillus altitudinis TaxID=293387 RepID=A0ABV1S5R2_BACAB